MIALDDLLAAGGRVYGQAHAQSFTDISYDSRRTRPGELFVALHTPRADGHDYIPAAIEAGATGILCSWPPASGTKSDPEIGTEADIEADTGATIIVADDPEAVLQQWAAAHLRRIDPTVVAVTGSVGKTSTKQAVATVLAGKGHTFASRESFNSLLGLPIALARLTPDHRYTVLEYGTDRFGEIATLASLFPPHIGIITSIGEAHIRSFGSLEGVAREKGALIEALPPTGWAILHRDDPAIARMIEQGRTAAQILTFGRQEACHLQASAVSYTLHGTHFTLRWQGHEAISAPPSTVEVSIPLLGEPAVVVALAAIGGALACGMSLADIVERLQLVEPVNGRLRPLPAKNGALLIDDTCSAALPSVKAALHTLANLPARRRIAVLGEGDEGAGGASVHAHDIGELAATSADMLICKGDWGVIAASHAARTSPAIKTNVTYTATTTLAALPEDIGEGDLILVKGSAKARMERVVAGLLDDRQNPHDCLMRQEPAWKTVRVGAPDRPTWLQIDLDAIGQNIRCLREIAGVPVMAVIKADGYGHGAVRVARAAAAGGATVFAVATLGEARILREADITEPILVLGYTPPWQAHEAVLLNVACTVFDLDVARAFSDAAIALEREATVHIKVDTGMGRLGLLPHDVGEVLTAIASLPRVRVEGMYSHFATADSNDESFARLQLSRFQEVVGEIMQAGLRPPIIHMANSAATLRFPEARFDIVRPGIACYGLPPSDETPLPPAMKPVLSFHTSIAQVKLLPTGSPLSYGCTFITPHPSTIATIPVGYADGFRRVPPWHEVLIRGKRAPVVGRVCMDYALIDVTGIEGVKRGDPVVLIGSQGDDCISADEVAGWLGTINYEVVSAILPRVPREVWAD